jgi:hypothetical protein
MNLRFNLNTLLRRLNKLRSLNGLFYTAAISDTSGNDDWNISRHINDCRHQW